jgi:SAM-dependent methyltransferase
MKTLIFNTLLEARARLMRKLKPKNGYFLAIKQTKPLSRKFGFDRGTPIDRFWIEDFVRKYKTDINGHVLEIGDRRYTTMFGSSNVTKSDILDLDSNNKTATIHADLSNVIGVKDNTYDCIIVTHVLGLIPEYEKAIAECYRMLKPNGVLLLTVSCFSPFPTHTQSFWRFTPKGIGLVIEKYFGKTNVTTSSYGNVLTGQCFWVGMSQEELTKEQLEYNDSEYPCIATCRAIKR